MKVKITQLPGAFTDAEGATVVPSVGDEIEVSADMGKALVGGRFAEEVKPKRKTKARTGPEETRG